PGPAGPAGPSGVLASGFLSGSGFDVESGKAFVVNPVTVTVAAYGQKVLVTSHRSLGSTVGAEGLRLWIGYRPSGSSSAPSTVGSGSYGIEVPANTRVPMGLSAVLTLTAGTYEVGLVASAPNDAEDWNSNEYGYTTALVFEEQ
ncbi:MAG: collagen-like protein, partial [Planctomycetota bacterium JB042]